MEFISAEEFLKQPLEVQKVFVDWWKPSKGDLFSNDITGGFGVITQDKLYKNGLIPLFSEGQLRKFIEDKTHYKVDFCLYMGSYDINICDNDGIYIDKYEDVDKSLLQTYWKVACEIAKEC